MRVNIWSDSIEVYYEPHEFISVGRSTLYRVTAEIELCIQKIEDWENERMFSFDLYHLEPTPQNKDLVTEIIKGEYVRRCG